MGSFNFTRLALALSGALLAAEPASASLDATRAFARGVTEDLGLEIVPCGEKYLARHTGEEHLCGRTQLPARKFIEAWDAAARRNAPAGVKQLGAWGPGADRDSQRLNYEVQGTPLTVVFAERGKRVTVSWSDYSWNAWPCEDGRYDEVGPVYDGDAEGEVAGGELVQRVRPEFPEVARVARQQAHIEMEILIDEDGRVGDVCVSGMARYDVGFEKASVDAVRQWTYRPATRDGVPVKVFRTVSTDFTLH